MNKTNTGGNKSKANNIPTDLSSHPFYGLELDKRQEALRDAIWDKNVRFVTVDSVAGSGKTTIAVATATLLYYYGLVDGCLYIRTPAAEGRMGFLPGDRDEKERPYMRPLYNTLVSLGENPYTVIDSGVGIEGRKYQTAFWTTMTDVYLLGDDFKRLAIIVDEAQCMTIDELRTIITRCHDDCKVIVIGSTRQIQGIDKEKSGFAYCINHFSCQPWARSIVLTKNYRGQMSAWADQM